MPTAQLEDGGTSDVPLTTANHPVEGILTHACCVLPGSVPERPREGAWVRRNRAYALVLTRISG